MTAENNLTEVPPLKGKAWVALIGSLLGAAVPVIGQLVGVLPEPYGAILSGILGVLSLVTGVAVHQTPYVPAGVVLAPASPQVIEAAQYPDSPPPNREPGRYENPWRD